ncbi:ABC transporter permease [Aliidongia dinghuensis]|uniref:ABC transporter permease n=1 Tax=Aliidongia dinghuensis TaxID=1867774 RepID=A0A8J3E3F7_9PROT|nr:ABC transporter permease subunit [Aliidongia dinghuensis]GGF29958.1 ABC transporter permease [Aliidongia dinghuensis]
MPDDRPEREISSAVLPEIADLATPLGPFQRLRGSLGFWRLVVLLVLAVAWEGYGRWIGNDLLFPTLGETLSALWDATRNGVLPARVFTSLRILVTGYALGLAAAAVFTTIAMSSLVGRAALSTLTAMFNPLPAVALLPLALLWFGLGAPSLIFVIVHSVLWSVSLNAYAGFGAVNQTLRMVGWNLGIRGWRHVALILVPAAFPAILSGLKIGWAFAWRTLIAAELVFGVSSRSGGIGWFIYENRNELDIASVFAGLLVVIAIGLLIEGLIFRLIERATIQRWGFGA